MKKLIAIIFLKLVMSPALIFSQAVISASGTNFQSSAGMISFTMGEVFTGNMQNTDGSASQGYQQPWDNLYGIPGSLDLENLSVAAEDILCFNALTTITVDGLTVNDGGSLTLIAGESVSILSPAIVHHGGYFHAYTGSFFCINPAPLLKTPLYDEAAPLLSLVSGDAQSFFRIYPNPFSNSFTLELNAAHDHSAITMEIYGAFGEKVQQFMLYGKNKHEINLAGLPRGIYLVRVVGKNESGMVKVIKQ